MSPIAEYIKTRLEPVFHGQQLTDTALWLAEEVSGMSRSELIVGKDTTFFPNSQTEEYINRLLAGEPLQYILGRTYWRGLTISLNRQTLIPRPETSELVDMVLKENTDEQLTIIDWCTGSGCIALALKQARRSWQVTGLDIEPRAVAKAQENAAANSLEVSFRQADVFKDINSYTADIIVCNPPYIPESEKQQTDLSVTEYEPSGALFVSEDDPLLFYRVIAQAKTARRLYFEIHPPLCSQLLHLLQSFGYSTEAGKDFAGKERFIKAQLSESQTPEL